MAGSDDLNLGSGDADEAGKSGGKGKLIIIIVVVLLLAGGGAAFFLMKGDDSASVDGADAEAAAEEQADKEPLYADIKKLLVNLEYGGRTHYVQAEMQLMSYSQDVINQAYRDMPAIRDRLIILFNDQDFAVLKTVEGKEALRAAELETVNKALGLSPPEVVEENYFENFVLQ
ncbi:MAG: hypothetical protein Cons2KO_08260 [Congregibacter sp.]